jgi:hypothetical protein
VEEEPLCGTTVNSYLFYLTIYEQSIKNASNMKKP